MVVGVRVGRHVGVMVIARVLLMHARRRAVHRLVLWRLLLLRAHIVFAVIAGARGSTAWMARHHAWHVLTTVAGMHRLMVRMWLLRMLLQRLSAGLRRWIAIW